MFAMSLSVPFDALSLVVMAVNTKVIVCVLPWGRTHGFWARLHRDLQAGGAGRFLALCHTLSEVEPVWCQIRGCCSFIGCQQLANVSI